MALGADYVCFGCMSGRVDAWAAGGGGFVQARTWNLKRSVEALALNEEDMELAACADAECIILSVATGAFLFRFQADGKLWGASIARTVMHAGPRSPGAAPRDVRDGLRLSGLRCWPVNE